MGRYRWSKLEIIDLIKKYEEFPELWDENHQDYNDVNKVYKAYLSLAKIFGTSEGAVRRKIDYLLKQFNNQVERLRENKDGYKWKYFDLFMFLLTPSDKALIKSNNEEEQSTEQEEITMYEETEDQVPQKNTRLHKLQIMNVTYDAPQAFGDYIASELRSLESKSEMKQLKLMIQKCIIQFHEERNSS